MQSGTSNYAYGAARNARDKHKAAKVFATCTVKTECDGYCDNDGSLMLKKYKNYVHNACCLLLGSTEYLLY